MIIEIIPERKGFMHDRARDLYVKLPIMKLAPEAAVVRVICHGPHSA